MASSFKLTRPSHSLARAEQFESMFGRGSIRQLHDDAEWGNSMDLAALERQFRGAKFGELVMEHRKKMDLATVRAALLGNQQRLPPEAQSLVESWLDEVGALGQSEEFWRADCGDVFASLVQAAGESLRGAGLDPTPDDLFAMFQLVVLNFAYAAHKEPGSKAFIQKALGVGFLGRLFG